MTSNDEHFTPEQVDEQIEQLQQTDAFGDVSAEQELVRALGHHYHVSLTARDHASLRRTRQRLGESQARPPSEEPPGASATLVSGAPPRRTPLRLARVLNALAAVLVLGALLGSWLVITHMNANRQVAAGTPGSSSGTGSTSRDLYIIQSAIAYRISASSGKVLWQHPVHTRKWPNPNRFGSAYLQVVGSTVYAVLDFDIYALDATTGQQRWHIVNHSQDPYASFNVDQGRVYVYAIDGSFTAYAGSDGHLLWHNTSFINKNTSVFSVSDGNIFMEKVGGTPESQRLYVLDGSTGLMRWNAPLPVASMLDAPLVAGGVVYYSSGYILYAVKEQDGTRLWQQTLPDTGNVSTAGPVNGVLFASTGSVMTESGPERKQLYGLDTRTGKILWRAGPGSSLLSLLPDGGLLAERVHQGGTGDVARLDPRAGRVLWLAPLRCMRDSFGSACSLQQAESSGGHIYLLEGSLNQQQPAYTLRTLDPGTGRVLSTHRLAIGQDNPGVIGLDNGLLYLSLGVQRIGNTITYYDTVLAAYRLSDGALAWNQAMPRLPAPVSANTSPYSTGAVLAP